MHYLCNQLGYLNEKQVVFEFNDALKWLRAYLANYPKKLDDVKKIIDVLKKDIVLFEEKWLNK